MSHIKLSILVQDTWRDRFPEVVENCRRAGLVVQRELIAVGIIIGSIDENSVSVLTQIEGVRAVERERTNWGLD